MSKQGKRAYSISFNNGFEMLRVSVIERACKDYIKALKANNRYTIVDCERFFKSPEFRLYSDIDGKVFLSKCKEKVKKWKS